jgi:hypothetical protein
MSKRFCEQCGAALAAGAHFCESCGARVDVPAPVAAPEVQAVPLPGAAVGPSAVRDVAPGGPAPLPPLFQPRSDGPHLPVRRGPSAAQVLGVLALSLVLLGGVGFWLYGLFGEEVDAPEAPIVGPESEPTSTPVRDPEAVIPGRAPPTAGSSRPSYSAYDVFLESANAESPSGSSAGRPPPPLRGGAAATDTPSGLPPIPVTDDPVDIDQLKALVTAANARDIDALYAASPGQRGPETREALAVAIRALAKGLYRHYVVDGHGDAERARNELRQFLSALEHEGLGLSDDAIEEGVAHVGP